VTQLFKKQGIEKKIKTEIEKELKTRDAAGIP